MHNFVVHSNESACRKSGFLGLHQVFNAFLPTFSVTFHTTHGQNKTHWFDTGGFVPVSSLCGIVGSPSWFIKFLIGKTGNIL